VLGDELYNEKPQVLGFGFFIRNGDDDAANKWRAESWFNKVERFLLSWDERYEMKFLQCANDSKAEAIFDSASDYDFKTVLKDYRLLGLLGVDPKCQRKGIGQQIMRQGLSIASREKVHVTLEASVVGRRLYQKMGFETIQRTPLAERLEGLEGGVAMLWEPDPLKWK
jgi:GNAT superfamily N-acetyltransferase